MAVLELFALKQIFCFRFFFTFHDILREIMVPNFPNLSIVAQFFGFLWQEFGECAFFEVLRGATSQIKTCSENSKLYRGAYIATYKIDEIPTKFMDFYGNSIVAILFVAKIHHKWAAAISKPFLLKP